MVTLASRTTALGWVNRNCGSWGHEPAALWIRNRSLVGLGSRNYSRSLIPLHKSEYHQDIYPSPKWRAHCEKSVGWMCSSMLSWACGGTNADTVGVCLCLHCWHHFSECVTQSWWFGLSEWNGRITHGIAHLQLQINTMAKTRQKCRKNNSHSVTKSCKEGKNDLKKWASNRHHKWKKANAYNSKIILTFFSHCVIIF